MAGGRVKTVLTLAAAAAAAVLFAPAVKRTIALGDRAKGAPVSFLVGRGFTLDLPAGRWYEARVPRFELTDGADPMDPDRPALEHRLLRAGEPAHLVVVSWRLREGGSLDLDEAAALVSEGSARRLGKWKLLGVAPLAGRGATRVLHATALLAGRDVELLWGLYPSGPTVHGVLVAAETSAFVRLRREFEGILASVRAFDPPAQP
jgi:hypothetical protein